MLNGFYELEVAFVRKETEHATQIGFKIPKELNQKFKFEAGQYLTIKAEVKNGLLRRAYSICSAEQEKIISVLVKRIKGGRVSNYLNDHVKSGDRMELMVPSGQFKMELEGVKKGTYYLIGAGSGITPLMSMIETILQRDDEVKCHLLYGNRSEEEIVFKNKLDRLELVYSAMF